MALSGGGKLGLISTEHIESSPRVCFTLLEGFDFCNVERYKSTGYIIDEPVIAVRDNAGKLRLKGSS